MNLAVEQRNRDLVWNRAAVSECFTIFGLIFGTWITHIPLAKERLQASASKFGLALLAMALGAVVTMPAVGLAVKRFSSALVCLVAAMLALAFLVLPFQSGSLTAFAFNLALLGAALGSLDVGTNAHGLLVENKMKRPLMSAFHGIYGVAALFSAAMAAVLIGRVPELYRAGLTLALGVLDYVINLNS